MNAADIVKELEPLKNQANIDGMKRYGIVTKKVFGIAAPKLKEIARRLKKEVPDRHKLALELWTTGVYEARVIAFFIDDPKLVTSKQMDLWAKDFDNWATVDGACGHLFSRSPIAYDKVLTWVADEREFIRRAGFSLIAYLAVHDKKASDKKIADFLPLIEEYAFDDRNFVKKAVNWALRQIGKRSLRLNNQAVKVAEKIKQQDSKSARWIAADALRELKSTVVIERLQRRANSR